MKYVVVFGLGLFVASASAQEASQDSFVTSLGQEFQASGIQQRHLAAATEALVKEYQRLKVENEKLRADAKAQKDKP